MSTKPFAIIMCIQSDFWISFWPSVIANLTAGFILSFAVVYVLRLLRNPKLEMVLSVATGTHGKRILSFYCKNSGRVGLMPTEIQWHLYIDAAFIIQDENLSRVNFMFEGKEYYVINGFNDGACLPDSSCLISNLSTVLDSSKFSYDFIDDAPFYYSLTTAKGRVRSKFKDRFKKPKTIRDLSQTNRIIHRIENVEI